MKTYILIPFFFISSFAIAQKFRTTAILSPGISHYRSSSSEVETNNLLIQNRGTGFCFSGAIREEYFFSKTFSLGVEVSYLNTNGKFSSPNPLWQGGIPEIYDIYKHSLAIYSIDIPMLLKIRTKEEITKGIYFYFGTGVSYIIRANRKIDRETGDMNPASPTDITSVTIGETTLKTHNNNSTGMIGVLGFGKNFVIKNKIFLCEVKYTFDLNKWSYPTVNDPINSSFDIKRQCLLLNFGFTF